MQEAGYCCCQISLNKLKSRKRSAENVTTTLPITILIYDYLNSNSQSVAISMVTIDLQRARRIVLSITCKDIDGRGVHSIVVK